MDRAKLFVPRQNSFPTPLHCLDVVRHTRTATFGILERMHMPTPPPGHRWVGGRLTMQATPRPEYVWPEDWSNMSKNSPNAACQLRELYGVHPKSRIRCDFDKTQEENSNRIWSRPCHAEHRPSNRKISKNSNSAGWGNFVRSKGTRRLVARSQKDGG